MGAAHIGCTAVDIAFPVPPSPPSPQQAAGKKRMKLMGKVEVPQEAFMERGRQQGRCLRVGVSGDVLDCSCAKMACVIGFGIFVELSFN